MCGTGKWRELLTREGRSAAESRPRGIVRLVRPGAASEKRTVSPPLPEIECAHRRKCGWYRGRFAFRPQTLGRKVFCLDKRGDSVKRRRILVLAALLWIGLFAACQRAAPLPDASPDPAARSQPTSASSPAPEPITPEPLPELDPDLEPEPESRPDPAPEPDPEPIPEPESEPEPIPEPEPEPSSAPVNTKLYVLMYHHFVKEGQGYNTWTLTDTRFQEDLRWLTEHGYTTVLPSQLVNREPLPEKAVMLTFDDGYRSNYQLAYPLLQEFQAKAVISIIVQYTQEENSDFLTWDMCREMSQSGLVEIGSHTYASHSANEQGIKRRKDETAQEYEDRVLPDLQASIDLIQEHLGESPQLFAYPNGVKEPWAAGFIQDHFAITLTTKHGCSDISKGLYSLRRCNVSMEVPLSEILPS